MAGTVSLATLGSAYTQDFDTLSNVAGSTTNNLTINGWYLTESGGGARDNEQYAVDTGGSTTGDIFSYGAAGSTERALGGLQSGTLIPTFGANFTNNTGSAITSLLISYTGEEWRLGTASRTDQLTFEYSLDATDLTTGTWASASTLNFITPDTATVGAKNGNTVSTALSGTISDLNIANGANFWIRWTDTNATGADDGLAVDNFSLTANGGPTGPVLSVSDATVLEGDAGTTTLQFTVSLTAPAGPGGVTFDIATADGTAQDDDPATEDNDYVAQSLTGQIIPEGETSYTFTVTVNNDDDVEPNETVFVNVTNVTGAIVADGQGVGTIITDDVTITPIYTIQGTGAASPLVGQTVTVEAIVVGDFQNGDTDTARNLGGFYLQELTGDGNPLTSDGIFIYEGTGNFLTNVAEGDRVRVTGTVSEFNGLTEIVATSVQVIQPIEVADVDTLAVTATFTSTLDLEKYEGMLIKLSPTLVITEQFELDRFNEVRLYLPEGDGLGGQIAESEGGRPYQYTQINDPNAVGYAAHVAAVAARTIVYADGLTAQNQPIGLLDGFQTYNLPGAPNAPQMGDTITNLTGVLDFAFGSYTVHAINDGDNTFTDANPREAQPDSVGGRLQVGSFNVLNYFVTLDAGGTLMENGLQPRGANSVAEFERQTEKLVTSILALDADVLGLIEIENDFLNDNPGDSNPDGNAIEYLVEQLNLRLNDDVYSYVYPGTEFLGGDAIAVGLIYKHDVVRIAPGTDVAVNLDPTFRRPPIAVTFEEIATGERFTAVVNHFKSKGADGATGANLDQGDGQSAFNAERVAQATALAAWLGTNPTGTVDSDYLLLGDYNSYYHEDPIGVLRDNGYDPLFQQDDYSYTFDGQIGTLDYALASSTLRGQVTGVTEWHINSDEADALNYNLDFSKLPGYFDGTNPYAVSDHDPVLIGLNLGSVETALTGSNPADGAIDVAIGANIVLTFNQDVKAGTGSIILRPATGADVSINVTSPQVTFNGNQVTINPTSNLRPGVAYDVIIGEGVITDLAGNPVDEIAQDELDFTTTSNVTIPAGTFSASFNIADPATYTLLAGTTRTQTSGVSVSASVASGSTTIAIDGTLNSTGSGRAINATLTGGGQVTIGADGSVQSLMADAIRFQAANAKVDLTNLGQIISNSNIGTPTVGGSGPGAGFAVQYNAITATGAAATDYTAGGVITNGAVDNTTALIQSNSGDAIRMGSHMTLINYGVIRGNGPVNDSSENNPLNPDVNHQSDDEKYDSSRGVRFNQGGGTAGKVENYGTIEGAQHAVDIGQDDITNIVINNHASGVIVGKNGSGIGGDTTGTAANTVTVENFGIIRGEYAPTFDRAGYATVDGDGDGVDIDGAATIINHVGATIAGSGAGGDLDGQGAGGFDNSGRANNSEGISIGGGLIINDGLISGANFAIVVNNDSNDDGSRSGVLATTITNSATGAIIGQSGFAIRLENKTGTASIDNDTITNFGTITGNGTVPDTSGTVLIQDGSADTSTDGILDGVDYTGLDGSVRFIRGDGSAIQMGEGDDVLTNHGTITGNSGRAINMEGGTDTLNFYTGMTITGRIDGGAGNDTINLFGNSTGTIGNVINVENLAVQAGVWTISQLQDYSSGTTITGGTLLVDGGVGAVTVNGGTLGGDGSVGAVTVTSGTLSPGASAGTLSTGNLQFASGATYKVELGGTGSAQFDSLAVSGTVTLGGATLDASFINSFSPALGQTFVVIANDGADAVSGTFAGLAEGATFVIGASQFSISYAGGTGNDVVLTATGSAVTPGPDFLPGSSQPDTVNGAGGDDIMFGGAGDDLLGGGTGDDTILGGDDDDTIWGEDGNDILAGNAGNDIIVGGDGNDIIGGDDGNDIMNGGDGDDTVFGGAGDDQVGGGDGNDIVVGDDGNDTVWGEGGDDIVNGGAGDDMLLGGDGNDQFGGGSGNDLVQGDAGNDTVWGEEGDDFLDGGTGDDILIGGAGDDTFVFRVGDGNDTITDFVAGGIEDRIWFAGTDIDSLADVQANASYDSGTNSTTITYSGSNTITLLGVNLANLTAGDFVFT